MPVIGSTPTTEYRLEGDRILDADGREVSPEILESQLREGKLQLREGALVLLGEVFEESVLDKLRAANDGKPTIEEPEKHGASVYDLGDSLPDPRKLTADIQQLLAELHEAIQAVKIATRERRHTELESEVQQLKDAADKLLNAAGWRLAAGLVTGVATGLGGVLSIRGGMKATKDLDVGSKGAEGAPKVEAPEPEIAVAVKKAETDAPKPRRDVSEVVDNATPRADVEVAKTEGTKAEAAKGEGVKAEGEAADAESKASKSKAEGPEDLLRRAMLQKTDGYSAIAKASGPLLATLMEFGAALEDKSAKHTEAQAKLTAAQADQDRELMDSVRELSGSIRSFLDTYTRSLSELESQVARL